MTKASAVPTTPRPATAATAPAPGSSSGRVTTASGSIRIVVATMEMNEVEAAGMPAYSCLTKKEPSA